MHDDLQIWLMLGSAFLAAATVAALAGNAILTRRRLRARLADTTLGDGDAGMIGRGVFREWKSKLSSIEDRFVGFDDADLRSKARMEIVRAGFFSPDAAKAFIIIRSALAILLPIVGALLIAPLIGNMTAGKQFLLALFMAFLGYFGPDSYIKRRQRLLVEEYRNVFPDFLDLLVVCMDAGSSMNAALERVGRDIAFQSKALATNVQLLVSEMRSGRSLVDALDSFSIRLGLDEAASLSTLIKQSAELGSDIGDALRTYSDEMREKRLSRAEEKANALPVKMVVPMGFFIFPVILITVLTPVIIKIAAALYVLRHGH
jgi:tight adherence protein C